jgi:hypothetical protein
MNNWYPNQRLLNCKVHLTEFRDWFSFLLSYIFSPKICGSPCGVLDITNLIESVLLPRQRLQNGLQKQNVEKH